MKAGALIATILRHDRKVASYKIALIRSLSDLALGYAHLGENGISLAVPLRSLAPFWIAYYWSFVSSDQPIMQGIHPENKLDISFRIALTNLRQSWEKLIDGKPLPSDGFFIITEMQSPQRRSGYPAFFITDYDQTIRKIVQAIYKPIQYAGPGTYSVFNRPEPWEHLRTRHNHITCIPGTKPNDQCLVLDAELWFGLQELSLWIEALCIHEWCLFTENITGVDRGNIYTLLTVGPINRRPLTWERNQVEILMLEGSIFECPWTGKVLTVKNYDLDHLLPLSVYPINELWNLLPANADFNRNKKRDRLPSSSTLQVARPRIALAYENYMKSHELEKILQYDALSRFNGKVIINDLPNSLVNCTIHFLETIVESRNLASF